MAVSALERLKIPPYTCTYNAEKGVATFSWLVAYLILLIVSGNRNMYYS